MELTVFGRRGLLFGIVLILVLIVVPALLDGQSFGVHLAAGIVAMGIMLATLVYWLLALWEA